MTISVLSSDFQYSQSSLQDYIDCARRFELRYVDRLRWPSIETEPIENVEQQMQCGEQFHRLIHQHQVGIDAPALEKCITDETIRNWWRNYLTTGLVGLPSQRFAERSLRMTMQGHQLVAKYDLLAIEPGKRAVIVDWKTSERRPNRANLLRRLQTIVYPYVLVEAGHQLNGGVAIKPSQVTMIYWFTNFPDVPQVFEYSDITHRENGDTIAALMREIDARQAFEKTDDVTRCRYCVYRSLCERGVQAGHQNDEITFDQGANMDLDDFDFDQVAEIEF